MASVQVDAADLRRRLRELRDVSLQAKLKATHLSAAQIVVEEALPHVPVRTGALRASVRAMGRARDAVVRAGRASVPYAAAIHWGRKSGGIIKGRPFLWDASERARQRVIKQYSEDIDTLLKQLRLK